MRTCAVKDCKSSERNGDRKFFKIPENPNFQWLTVINRHDYYPSKNSFICDLHFPWHKITGNHLEPGIVPFTLPEAAVVNAGKHNT